MGVLNTWYSSNLASYASKLTSGTGFCNDRDMASGYNWSATPIGPIYYAAYRRVWINLAPTLNCNTASDNFTTSGTGTGNGVLTNPIGLITVDEVAMAGGSYGTRNSVYYLHTNQDYWTMSPYHFNIQNGYAGMFHVCSDGSLNFIRVNNMDGVRPVINLRADVKLSGSGTSSDPYVVS